MSLSLAGITTEIKCALWERKYLCDTKGKNIYMKFIKTKYNKTRRAAAAMEIEEALSDFDYEDEGDLLEVAYEDLYSCYYDAFPDLDDDWDEDPWDYDGYEEDRNAFYEELEARENLEMALRGDWQEEVPEVFGDEFEAIVAA